MASSLLRCHSLFLSLLYLVLKTSTTKASVIKASLPANQFIKRPGFPGAGAFRMQSPLQPRRHSSIKQLWIMHASAQEWASERELEHFVSQKWSVKREMFLPSHVFCKPPCKHNTELIASLLASNCHLGAKKEVWVRRFQWVGQGKREIPPCFLIAWL